jgi:hypothetical protein
MPRAKKPDAPKFEPVTIAGYRPAGMSLATSDAESAKILDEDRQRIAAETLTAELTRLEVLQKHLGLEGELGNVAHLLMLLIAVANKYVDGFAVRGKPLKSGPGKIAERFKIVTMVEARAAAEKIKPKAAIRELAEKKINGRWLSADSLTTKYFASLAEIKGHPTGAALLNYWRKGLPDDLSAEMGPLFWAFENEHLKAVNPHNVHQFPSKK